MKRRSFSLFVVLLMVLLSLPVLSVAAEDTADDSQNSWEECQSCSADHPHMISTTEDLDKIRTHIHADEATGTKTITGYFKLANDIVFDDADFKDGGKFYNAGQTWIPLGHTNVAGDPPDAAEFCGTFDGDGHSIKNLKICPIDSGKRNRRYSALFMALGKDGAIVNTVFDGASNSTKHAAAIVVGKVTSPTARLSNITIQNCELIPAETSNNSLAPSFLSYYLTGTVSNIKLQNCRYGLLADGSGTSGAPWFASVIGSKIANCSIDGFTVSGCSFRFYADAALLFNSAEGTAPITLKNIKISDTEIINTHRCSGWIRSASADSNVSMENVTVDIKNTFRGSIDKPTIPATLKLNMENVSMLYTYEGNASFNTWWNLMADAAQASGTAQLRYQDTAGGKAELDLNEHIYSIKSMPDGASISSAKYWMLFLNGGAYTEDTTFPSDAPAIPTKSGSIFYGWYEDDKCIGEPVAAPTMGKPYYAKWLELKSADISFEYGSTAKLPAISGVTLSGWKSNDEDVVKISGGSLVSVHAGETTITASATTASGGTGTLTVKVKVTPMLIIYGPSATGADGLPDITYPLKADGTTYTISELLGFYPVKSGANNTYVPDMSKPSITLKPGMGADGDVEYFYRNDASGNELWTDTLPAHPTVDSSGTPHSITVKLRVKNPDYRFCTVGTHWTPKDTITLQVTCYEKGMTELDMYLGGDKDPVVTFDDRLDYEYTGEGILPTTRDLTTLYTKGTGSNPAITEFTAHFHAIEDGSGFSASHLTNQPAAALTSSALKKIAPQEPGVYSFVINGYNENTKSYCYASRRYRIVKGNPVGAPAFEAVSSGVQLSSVALSGTMKNAAGKPVEGVFTWADGNQSVARGSSYRWTFTPADTQHYETVSGEVVVWPLHTAHDWEDSFTVDKAPTATESGIKSIHCKQCDERKDITVIPALGSSDIPSTGDGSHLGFVISLLACLLAGAGLCGILRKFGCREEQ